MVAEKAVNFLRSFTDLLRNRNPVTTLFYLLLLTLPFQFTPALPVAGFDVRISQVFLLIATVILALNPKKIVVPKELFLLLPFFLFSIISVSISQNSTRGFIFLSITLFTFLSMLVAVNSKINTEKVWFALKTSGFLLSGFALYQFLADFAGLPQIVTLLRDAYVKEILGIPRPHGFLSEPLFFANYLAFLNFISLALIFAGRYGKSELALFILTSTGIILSVSRGAIAGYLFVLSFFLLFNINRLRKFLPLTIPVAAATSLCVGIFLLIQPGFLADFTDLLTGIFVGGSAEQRNLFIQFAHKLYIEHPFFGIGTANYGPLFFDAFNIKGTEGQVINNQYFELLVENGIFGFVTFMIFLVFLIHSLIRTAFSNRVDQFDRSIVLGIFLGFCVTLIQWLTFSTLYTLWIWVFIGIAVAIRVKWLQGDEVEITEDRSRSTTQEGHG
jgi:O-antigen ligase